jgi:hypothetical protein
VFGEEVKEGIDMRFKKRLSPPALIIDSHHRL